MSHGLSSVSLKDVPAIVGAEPFRLPALWRVIAVVFIIFGMVIFGAEVLFGGDVQHAWLAFHLNVFFWFCLSAATTCFAAVLHVCNAQWARPIRRLFESAATFFLYTPVLLAIVYVLRGYEHLFIWSHEAIPGKEHWLTANCLYFRDIVAMCVLIFVGRRVVYYSIRQDIGAIRGGLTGIESGKLSRWSDKRYDCYVSNWGSDAKASIRKTYDQMGVLSPVVIIIYALVISLLAFDQLMSVDPHWYSTLFGGFIFMGAVYMSMGWCSMWVGLARAAHPLFCLKVERRTLHDLGKLMFGFGIFWAYLFWSHYLPIWYGNMPEETKYIILRLREQPWHDVAWIVLGLCFIIPFLLGLSRDVKQVPALLFCTGMIVACGIWLEHYLLFTPSLYPHDIPFNVTDVAVTLGFFGAFLLSCASFLEKAPLMPFGDLYVETPPEH